MDSARESKASHTSNWTDGSGAPGSLSSMAEQAREQAGSAASSLKQRARRVAEQQKASGAEQISGMAQAIDGAADELGREMPQAAEYIHDMAGRLENAASALRERSVDDLIQQTSDFARRQPVAFFAGALLTGFALSRFLKSSSAGQQG